MRTRESRSLGSKLRSSYGHVIVIAGFFILLVVYGAYYAFGVFFKPVLTEFGWTRAMTSGAFSLSMVLHGLLSVVMGGLNDRFGPRVVLTLCGFLLSLGYILMSQIGTIWQLYLFYGIIIGTGMAGVWVPLLSTVARWFVKRTSMMTGIVLSGSGVGALVAPPVANLLISVLGWRTSYLIIGGLLLIVVVIAAHFLRRDPDQARQLPYGGSGESGQAFRPRGRGLSLKKAICIRQFWQCFAMLFCFGFIFFVIVVHTVPHATELGISPATAAGIFSVMGGMMIIGRLALSAAADKIGDRQIFIIGFILLSVGVFWLVPAREVWELSLLIGVIGFAMGGMGASESPLAAKLFGLSSHGLIYGLLTVGFTMGAAIGPLLAGYIFDKLSSYQAAFLICAAISIVGLITTILLKPVETASTYQPTYSHERANG